MFPQRGKLDCKLTRNISGNSVSRGKTQGMPYIYVPRARDTLISARTAGGEPAEWILTRRHTSVTIWSISRARKFPGDGSGRGLALPSRVSLPLRYPAEPLPTVPSFHRGLSEGGATCGYFAMRRRRTARAFRDTPVIIRRRCRNGVPARGMTRKRVDGTGKDVSNTAESCGDPGEVGKAPRGKTRFLRITLVIYLE